MKVISITYFLFFYCFSSFLCVGSSWVWLRVNPSLDPTIAATADG
jgi:hypothetical protein